MNQMIEPTITINGRTLSDAQASTMRVALEQMAMTLHDQEVTEFLGDEIGDAIRKAYQRRIDEIRHLIHS